MWKELSACENEVSIFPQGWFPFPGVLFGPTVEPEHPDAFITHSVEEAYEDGHVENKPWILTTTKDEGITAVLSIISTNCPTTDRR
jgi:hypothetical protein